MIGEFLRVPRVAYFSMEIALRNEIPTYAGGLGVLAGDTLRAAADLRLPLVAVTLVSRAGYFRQEIDASGRQREHADTWEPSAWGYRLDAKVAIRIEGRPVWIGAWLYVVESDLRGRIPVILLDTDLPENTSEDRQITHFLYGGDETYRLQQEMVLGVGGVRTLHALGFEISRYHMNEGHSALLGVELLRRHAYAPEDLRPGEMPYDVPRVRELCRFTTHTPVEAGHDRFSYDLVKRLFSTEVESDASAATPASLVNLEVLREIAGADQLNMTQLALGLSDFVNGVAKSHAEMSSKLYPGYQVRAITNGVHPVTWTAAGFQKLYDRHVPGWRHEPELLVRADTVTETELLGAHSQAKDALIGTVRRLTGIELSPQTATLGFARRMTSYKRPDLLFADIPRLRAIAREHPLQIILAGKAHPRDEEGRRLIEWLHARARELTGELCIVYLPNYDMALAQELVAGCDVWVNTPLPPFEASGTSGMKAAFNGVPSLSVAEGWWVEGCIEGVTGWSVLDSVTLYDKLEHLVLPLFYTPGSPRGWATLMRNVITKNPAYFNSHRMMRRYATEAYLC